MRMLILGGTGFAGRAIAEEALARGWDVTLFNRGSRPAPHGARLVGGDRTDPRALAALGGTTWDVVADTWAGAPRVVRDSAAALAGRAGRYVYVSSRSVYDPPVPAGADETAPVVAADPGAGDVPYPEAKRGGELAALAAFGERALLVRAGLIIGPYEDVGRLPWWLDRVARGGPFVAPGPRDLPIQYVDVRDLARWTLDVSAAGLGGAFDVVSPPGHATIGDLVDACVHVTGSGAEPRWIAPEVILGAGVEPWTDLPVWIPPGPLHDTIHGAGVAAAVAAGLRCRPLAETVADTWAWLRAIGGRAPQRPDRPPVGLTAEQQERLLRG